MSEPNYLLVRVKRNLRKYGYPPEKQETQTVFRTSRDATGVLNGGVLSQRRIVRVSGCASPILGRRIP